MKCNAALACALLLCSLLVLTSSVFAAIESPHGPLTLDCQLCHTTDNWTKMKLDSGFSHDAMTGFPLVGRHRGVACISCHATLRFSETTTQCSECHTDIHRGQFSNNCSECHTPNQWADDMQFRKRHESTRFPLVGVHATLDCQSCHANGQYTELGSECIDCHREQFAGTTTPNHETAGFSKNCTVCHDVAVAKWQGPRFAHTQAFPLTGGHALSDCQRCHSAGYENTPNACLGCHQSDYSNTQNPTHSGNAFPTTCETCHTTTAWQSATFENHSLTAFPLTGAHVQTNCVQCHVGGQYSGTTTQCAGCHEADYTDATNPTHDDAVFGQTCEQCHTTAAWRPAEFANHALTQFPLTGRHVQTDCAQCHVGGQFTGTPADCWSCHEAEYNETTDPNHVESQFPQNCAACHSTDTWDDAQFNHDNTAFPLTGTHITTECLQCHVDGQYTGTPTDCWSCHAANYNEVEDHVQNSFPHDCALCHNTTEWDQASFDHNNTAFPLTGRHVQTDCAQCHIGGVYSGTPTDCWSCHETDYTETIDPNHVANSYPHDCLQCHSTENWDSNFDHNNTQFPLTGRHVQTNCTQCHVGGVFEGTPTDCWSCHEADYNDAEGHVQNGFPHDCAVCHNTNDWDESTFNHSNTDFPLTGRHIQTNCGQCHIGGVYDGTPTDCWSCHEADYNDADDHQSQNFPHDCALCHNTSDWEDANFNHNNTDFPLTGRHVQTDCNECHVGGIYDGTPTDCWSCHQDDYNVAEDHLSQNYPHDCSMCHNTSDWEDGDFNHGNTDFPLTGAHVTTGCLECHVGGQFENTPTDCWFCHQADYNSASPDHNTGYPQGCTECHTTNNWNSTFNHDQQYFPIYSGEHRNEWNQCSECHTTAGNFNLFSCIDCHEHSDRNDVDDEHDDVGGYTYTPTSCYVCHPDGREGPNVRGPSKMVADPARQEVQK